MLITAAALAFLVNVGGALFNWIFQKAGRVTTQVVIFVLALVAAFVWFYKAQFTGFWALLQTAGLIFSLAVTFYEIILGYFPAFKGPSSSVN